MKQWRHGNWRLTREKVSESYTNQNQPFDVGLFEAGADAMLFAILDLMRRRLKQHGSKITLSAIIQEIGYG